LSWCRVFLVAILNKIYFFSQPPSQVSDRLSTLRILYSTGLQSIRRGSGSNRDAGSEPPIQGRMLNAILYHFGHLYYNDVEVPVE